MLSITTVSFQLKLLSEKFFSEIAPTLKEHLYKEKRPYCVLLVQVKGFTFALPLRSHLPTRDGVGLKTVDNLDGSYKGIDFSKAVIIPSENQESYFSKEQVRLRSKEEFLFILGQDRKIQREFKKYVSGYITAKKNQAKLDDKYMFTTLINYHRELKIE